MRFPRPMIPLARSCCAAAAIALCAFAAGCGTTQQSAATEQLLASDAVDTAIASIDFAPLTGQKVFLDTKYLQDYKGIGFVNSGYIVSSLRQQMMAAGCLLQEKEETADYIVEGRIGALGTDRHDVVYGLPASNALSNVSTVVAGVPAIPPIPELSVARKAANLGATKLALFAYERESRQRVWQSGLSVARSTARDTWILGAGPFQAGTIYKDNVRFAGSRLALPFMKEKKEVKDGNLAAFQNGALYKDPREPEQPEAPQMLAADENAKPVDVTEPAAPVQQASGGKEAPAKEAAVQQTSGEKTDKAAAAPAAETPAAETPAAAAPAAAAPPAS